jgi:hypothetical protein
VTVHPKSWNFNCSPGKTAERASLRVLMPVTPTQDWCVRTLAAVDYLLNLSILLSRGNERNFDVFSSGERTRQKPKI